uniref:BHLH domain-containing protein n=1 Tax=Kalanchoe fedtschenkoi TaxID=63787 RepID=A0A7N0TNT6_KALFE
MGLSCYMSNRSAADYMLQQEQLLLELGCFQDDFTLAHTSIDALFHPPQQKHPSFIPQPPQLPTTHFENFSSQLLPCVQQKSCHPKRQKIAPWPHPNQQSDTHFNYDSMLACGTAPFVDGCWSSAADDAQLLLPLAQEFQGGDQSWLQDDFPAEAFLCGATADRPGSGNNSSRPGRGGGGGLSAQSIAARQRRRKIADKTQELGKLIPGGHRMNTAEMFQSASMYVKFLQAQIAMLTLTDSLQVTLNSNLIQVLVASPVVQEKLYTQEKCLVPRRLVQSLPRDSKLQSLHPSLIKQINNLLQTPRAE